jgi:hypothetical protein
MVFENWHRKTLSNMTSLTVKYYTNIIKCFIYMYIYRLQYLNCVVFFYGEIPVRSLCT